MATITVTTNCGVEKEFDTRADAEDGVDTHVALCDECGDGDVTMNSAEDTASAENGAQQPDGGTVEVVEELPDEKPAVDEDPVDWMPSHFVDEIEGKPALNRKGYAVICERFGVSVTAEPITLASETGFEYAEFEAAAVTADGEEYSGFGSAHIDRGEAGNTDDKHLLNELAETRAMKRAAAWATGIGMTAVEELQAEP